MTRSSAMPAGQGTAVGQRRRTYLLVGVLLVALAAAAAGIGYAQLHKTVTLSVDGKTRQVDTFAETVGDVLAEQGIDTAEHDIVMPTAKTAVTEDTRIAVRYARKLTLTVDGQRRVRWVTARDVDTALEQLNARFAGASLSTSRGTVIGRDGLHLRVTTPKSITVKVGDHEPTHARLPVLTVQQALDRLHLKVDANDEVKPGRDATLHDGDTITITRVRVEKHTRTKPIDHETVKRASERMYADQSRTVQEGRDGVRTITYRVRYENGQKQATTTLDKAVTQKPVKTVVAHGTKQRPTPEPSPEPQPEPAPEPQPEPAPEPPAGGVWDALAQCESGGNWHINSGNGYYGGLQFSLSTWHAYGGTGYPHQHSRAEQIRVAERVRAATGGYGSWPACAAQLGLPQ